MSEIFSLHAGYWSGLPFPSPGDLPNPSIEAGSPVLQADSSPLLHLGSPLTVILGVKEMRWAL